MNECDVCNNLALLQRATCDDKAYRWSVVKSLCFIIELMSVEEETSLPPTTTILPQVAKGFAQIESGYATYATVGVISTALKLNSLRVVNDTNADLEFSYDGGSTTAFIVLGGTEYQDTLNLNLNTTTDLQMKKAVGQTASSGSVYIEGRYDS